MNDSASKNNILSGNEPLPELEQLRQLVNDLKVFLIPPMKGVTYE